MLLMQLTSGVTGAVRKQPDSSEQVTLHCEPLIRCIYQMYHSDRAGIPLMYGFTVISTGYVPKQTDNSELACVFHSLLI